MRTACAGIGLLLTLAAGCGRELPSPNGGRAATGSAAAAGTDVTFKAADGWQIHGVWSPAAGAKRAVVLLHQREGSAADWQPLLSRLRAAGISALAIDQRGAGKSLGAQNGGDAPWDTTPDIAGAVAWLRAQGVDAKHAGLGGASYGANNALIYAAAHPEVPAVVLLSPGKDYHGLQALPAAQTYAGPVLILAAKGDGITQGGPQAIATALPHGAELHLLDGQAHGTELFGAHPQTLDTIADFFKAHL